MPLSERAQMASWAWPFVDQSAAKVTHDLGGIITSADYPIDVTRTPGARTADLWDLIKQSAPDEALWRTVGFGAGLSTLRGYANRMVNAQTALARADPSWALDASMIAEAPWSRPLAQQNALGKWQVRVPVTGTTRAGVAVSKNISVFYQGSLPQTVGALVDDATMSAINTAASSDFNVTGTSVPQVLAV